MRDDESGSPDQARRSLGQFRASRALLPVLLGLLIVAFLLYQETVKHGLTPGEMLARLRWSAGTGLWLFAGVMTMVLRDFGYVWQLRILTDRRLTWVASFQVVMLWNFFAAVSPSMVGGGAGIAVWMLCKEGLSLGRSTAIVFTTVFLDQAFFVSIPLLVSTLIPQHDIFAPLKLIPSDFLGTSVYSAFWSAWGGIAAYVALLIAALFVAPSWINWWLRKLILLPFMHRWRERGFRVAHDLLMASRDLRARSTLWWFQVWAATSVAWIGRYLVLNCVLGAFNEPPMGVFEHVLAIGRQAVLWIVMLISPTPGSAGIAELGFTWLFKDLVPAGLALTLAIFWRLISYYPHLVLGVPVMTHWIRRVYGRDVREEPANTL